MSVLIVFNTLGSDRKDRLVLRADDSFDEVSSALESRGWVSVTANGRRHMVHGGSVAYVSDRPDAE